MLLIITLKRSDIRDGRNYLLLRYVPVLAYEIHNINLINVPVLVLYSL